MRRGPGQQKLDVWQWDLFVKDRVGSLYELKPLREGEVGFYRTFTGLAPARFLPTENSLNKYVAVEMPLGIYMLTDAHLVDRQLSLIDNVSDTVRAYGLKFLMPGEKLMEAKFSSLKEILKFLDSYFTRLK